MELYTRDVTQVYVKSEKKTWKASIHRGSVRTKHSEGNCVESGQDIVLDTKKRITVVSHVPWPPHHEIGDG